MLSMGICAVNNFQEYKYKTNSSFPSLVQNPFQANFLSNFLRTSSLTFLRLSSMADLAFCDTHNMVAFLHKVKENKDFHEIIDFLLKSHIQYALSINPTIYSSHIRQFWDSAKMNTINDVQQIEAKVDDKPIIITEESIRTDLHLDDATGIDSLPNQTIFDNLKLMGYEGSFDKLTFYKALVSPQWRFLIHTILQCLSQKRTSWNEFSSIIASAIVCLATNQKFNFSKLIFNGLLWNLEHVDKKFLMYPRFIQLFLNNHIEGLSTPSETFVPLSHTKKVFSNMKRVGKEFSGKVTPLFSTMVGVPTIGGEGSSSQQVQTPNDPQPTPPPAQTTSTQPELHQNIPQSPLTSTPPTPKDTHIAFQRKKTKRAPPSLGSTPSQPKSPQVEQSSLGNIQREPTEMSPNLKEVVTKEMHDHMVRATTTASGLGPEQDSGNINKTQSMATSSPRVFHEPEVQEGPRRQETKGGFDDQTRSDTFPSTSNDPLRMGTPSKQGEDRELLNELKELCTRMGAALVMQQILIEHLQSSVSSLKKIGPSCWGTCTSSGSSRAQRKRL